MKGESVRFVFLWTFLFFSHYLGLDAWMVGINKLAEHAYEEGNQEFLQELLVRSDPDLFSRNRLLPLLQRRVGPSSLTRILKLYRRECGLEAFGYPSTRNSLNLRPHLATLSRLIPTFSAMCDIGTFSESNRFHQSPLVIPSTYPYPSAETTIPKPQTKRVCHPTLT